jgi:hypothetical protein
VICVGRLDAGARRAQRRVNSALGPPDASERVLLLCSMLTVPLLRGFWALACTCLRDGAGGRTRKLRCESETVNYHLRAVFADHLNVTLGEGGELISFQGGVSRIATAGAPVVRHDRCLAGVASTMFVARRRW